MRHSSVITISLLVLVGTATCDRVDRSARTRQNPISAADTASRQRPAVGATLRTSITGDEPLLCAQVEEVSRSEGPCQRFRLRTPEAGVLGIHVTWDDRHPLRLRLRTLEGAAQSTTCCRSPMDLRAHIDAGDAYEIDVILLTDWGSRASQPFELTASVQTESTDTAHPVVERRSGK